MSKYNLFAKYYDRLTENINYKEHAKYFCKLLNNYNKVVKTVLDMACGTGSLSIELKKLGFDVIGLDSSCEMLSFAQQKAIEEDERVAVYLSGNAEYGAF